MGSRSPLASLYRHLALSSRVQRGPAGEQMRREIFSRLGIDLPGQHPTPDPPGREGDLTWIKRPWSHTRALIGREPMQTRKLFEVHFTTHQKRDLTVAAIDQIYNPTVDPKIRLSPDAYQARTRTIYDTLAQRIDRELAGRRLVNGNLVVLQGGYADRFNALTFPTGAIVLHRALVDDADRLGIATAIARSSEELMRNIGAVADGSFVVPATYDKQRARYIADGVIAAVLSHEMVHNTLDQNAIGVPRGNSDQVMQALRKMETIADVGGSEIATRGGYSPLGSAALVLYNTMRQAKVGKVGPSSGTHPSGIERYNVDHRYLSWIKDRTRPLYDGKNPHTVGAKYMTETMRAELSLFPIPARLLSFAERYAKDHQSSAGLADGREEPLPPFVRSTFESTGFHFPKRTP